MGKTYGVGLLGAGVISETYLKLASLFGNIEIRAIADIIPEAAARRASEFGIRAQTPEQMLKDSEIDVIVNLTVPEVHYRTSSDIVSAGKHVYSEKPLVLTLEEGQSLRSAAAHYGVQVGCAPDTFLGGANQQARALIDSGAIGPIASGTCHQMGIGMDHWHPNPHFFYRPGGGPEHDIGPYYLSSLVNLIGPIRRVTALAATPRRQRNIPVGPRAGEVIEVATPTTIHAVMEFHSGAVVTLGLSRDVEANQHANIELYGLDGSLYLPNPIFFGGEIVLARRDDTRDSLGAENYPFGMPNWGKDSSRKFANYRTVGLADMMRAVSEGRAPRCSLDLALHQVEVMKAILTSAERGEAVAITTTCERPEALGFEEARSLLA